MDVSEFDEYKKSVLALKEKYKDKITILLGMEAEYYPMYQEWLLEFCVEQEIDYLILGNHYYLSDEYGIYFGHMPPRYLNAYFDMCIEGLRTGMYAYLAHPELIMRNEYMEWYDVVEEGFQKYVWNAPAFIYRLNTMCSECRPIEKAASNNIRIINFGKWRPRLAVRPLSGWTPMIQRISMPRFMRRRSRTWSR